MAVQLKVKNNIKKIRKQIDALHDRQLPFVTALALTRTAQAAQKKVQDDIPKHFKVTKKWWLKQQPTGIRIISAKKKDLTAWVYTDAYFAPLQEYGGQKTPHKGRALLIPSKNSPKYSRRSGGSAKVFKNKKTIFHNGSPFVETARGVKVLQRVGKRRYPLKVIYNVKRAAEVKPEFDFRETVKAQALASFEQEFWKAAARALKD